MLDLDAKIFGVGMASARSLGIILMILICYGGFTLGQTWLFNRYLYGADLISLLIWLF